MQKKPATTKLKQCFFRKRSIPLSNCDEIATGFYRVYLINTIPLRKYFIFTLHHFISDFKTVSLHF